jgi:hypothetical protein
MDHGALPDPASLANFDSTAVRNSLVANRHGDVLICVTVILNEDGRLEHDIAAKLYAILGGQKTPRTDYGVVANSQNGFAVFLERGVRAKIRILIQKDGIAKRDAVRLGPVQLASEVNRYA